MSFTVTAIQQALKQLGRLNCHHPEGGWDGTTANAYVACAESDNHPVYLHTQPLNMEQCTPSVRQILEVVAAMSPQELAASQAADLAKAEALAKQAAEREEIARADAARVAAATLAATVASSALANAVTGENAGAGAGAGAGTEGAGTKDGDGDEDTDLGGQDAGDNDTGSDDGAGNGDNA